MQLLQQHINRSVKRYARMKGRTPPTKREMEEKIAKRMFIPEGGRPKFNANSKRYNRKGASKTNPVAAVEELVGAQLEPFAKGKGKKHKQQQAAANANTNATAGADGTTDADNGQLTPANAPTGPKNAGQPGANYRGGGRGGRRGYHPYARGGM